MANIKSAKKRILVIEKKTLRNKMIKSQVKTAVKKVLSAIEAKDAAAAKESLTAAISAIDKAKSKGIFHKNNAARKISRLTKAVNKLTAEARTYERTPRRSNLTASSGAFFLLPRRGIQELFWI